MVRTVDPFGGDPRLGPANVGFEDRSGFHRVVDSEAFALRELLAAVGAVGALARSPSIGPRALREELADLRAACDSAPVQIASSLVASCDVVALSTGLLDESRSVCDGLVRLVATVCAKVILAVDDAKSRGLGARTRLALQAACDEAIVRLSEVGYAVEVLQHAASGRPIPLVVSDLFRELELPPRHVVAPPNESLGLVLGVSGDIETPVVVQPRNAKALFQGAMQMLYAPAQQRSASRAMTAMAEVHRMPDGGRSASAEGGGRVRIAFRPVPPSALAPRTGRTAEPSTAIWTLQIPFDPSVTVAPPLLRLALASVAGDIEAGTIGGEPCVAMTLLCA